MAEPGRYLFAVTRDLPEKALAGVPGLRGAGLDVVDVAGLQAVVCDVDLAEFGEDSLRDRLEDLAWLEEVARAHNDVVLAVASAGTVAPMRLVTICSDDASVRARLEGAHQELTRALDRVQGRHEWSVKVYADPPGAPGGDPVAATVPADGSEGGKESGAAYLQRKRRQAEARRSGAERAAEEAEAVHAELSAHTVAARRLAPQDPRLTGVRMPMTLNAAYLVEEADGAGFRDLVAQVAHEHPESKIEVEGPWPPYSFAVLEDG